MISKEAELQRLSIELARLPGVGRRAAERMALFLVLSEDGAAESIADAIIEARVNLGRCPICGNLSKKERPCSICASNARDESVICVVESVPDLWAIEESGVFDGVYHVLHGTIAPLDGIGPEELNMESLFERIKRQNVKEVILATDPTVDGNATAFYIAERLRRYENVKVSRIAVGLPSGSDIQFADRQTLENAILARKPMDG